MPPPFTITEFTLREDETAQARAVVSDGVYWKAAAVFALSMIVMVVVHPNLGGFLMLVAALTFLAAYLRKAYTMVLVTNQRLLIRQGVFFVDSLQLRFSQIESVEVMRTPIGMALGYGMLIVTGTGTRQCIVPFIENATAIRQAIDNQMAGLQ